MPDVTYRSDMTVILDDVFGDDAKIVRCAKVSTKGVAAAEAAAVDVERFLTFLWREGHTSPFRHVSMTFLVTAPIFVWEQHAKHTVGVDCNSESARYSELKPVFYVPAEDRPLAQIGKAASYELVAGSAEQGREARLGAQAQAGGAWREYQWQLSMGVAREVARMVLPVSIYRSAYVTLSVHALLHFLNLRGAGTHAQREIQMVAEGYERALLEHFPATHAAWTKTKAVA